MARRKTTVYIEDELLKAAKVMAARNGKHEYEVFEDALKKHMGLELLDRIWQQNDMDEDEAMKLAYDELHAMRAERR